MNRLNTLFAVLAAILLGLTAPSCSQKQDVPKEAAPAEAKALTAAEEQELKDQASALFGALPASMPGAENDTPELIALGEKLYMDTRLSVNDKQSCNSCHMVDQNRSGVDNLPVSPGAKGGDGDRNSPTVLNAGFQFVQFWDGRAEDLVAQAKGPILNPGEMAMPSEKAVEQKIGAIPEYAEAFKAVFPKGKKPVSYHNIATAIAAFERTLRSPSRFDDYIAGNATALTNAEKRGMKTFIESGCITCHMGTTFGGAMYQKLGLVNPYESKDAGRYEVTKDPADSLMFKVPMLRNVALTAPYFHDGSVKTLDEAVSLMGWHQLGKKLTKDEITSIVTFLNALSDPKRVAVKS